MNNNIKTIAHIVQCFWYLPCTNDEIHHISIFFLHVNAFHLCGIRGKPKNEWIFDGTKNYLYHYTLYRIYFDGLVQEFSKNSRVLPMELLQSCTKPSIWQFLSNMCKGYKLANSVVYYDHVYIDLICSGVIFIHISVFWFLFSWIFGANR